MAKQYLPWNPGAPYLFPPSSRDWLPPEHLCYFVMEVVGELDISRIEGVIQGREGRGQRPFDPRLMLSLWFYAYAVGVHSSRGLERSVQERVDFRAIAGDARPTFTTLNRFRKEHRAAFKHLFVEVLRLCDQMGLVTLGHVAIDGTKVKADASKHKAMSYGRMRSTLERLDREIEELIQRSEALDAEENRRFGDSDGGLPEELRHRQGRRDRIRAAMEALEREAAAARAPKLRQNAENKRKAADGRANPQDPVAKALRTKAAQDEARAKELDGRDDDEPPPPPTQLPRAGRRHDASGAPHDKAQRNFTDPDSRIMLGRDGFIQGYNAQAAVDSTHQLFVAVDVTNQAPDAHNFSPMLRQAAANMGRRPTVASGDCGYWSEESALSAEEMGVGALIPLERTKRWKPGEGKANAPPPEGASPRERMAHTMSTEAGREGYRLRGRSVEPTFGHIKEIKGFRQFSFRGLAAVAAEWQLVCLAQNLWKAWRARTLQPA